MGKLEDSIADHCGGIDPMEMSSHLDDLFNAFILADEFLGSTDKAYKTDVYHTVNLLKKALNTINPPQLAVLEHELLKVS